MSRIHSLHSAHVRLRHVAQFVTRAILLRREVGAATSQTSTGEPERPENASVVFLTNTIPAYRAPLVTSLSRLMPGLVALVSPSPVATNIAGGALRQDFRVETLSLLKIKRTIRHPAGYREAAEIHVPWNVVPKLFALKPRAVLASELGMRTLQAAIYTALRPRVPLLIHADLSEHTEQAYGRWRRAFRRLLLRRAARVIVNGSSGATYVQRLSVPPEKVVVIPYATDSSFLEPSPPPPTRPEPRRLIYVGQFIERKGLLPFIEDISRWCVAHPAHRVAFTLVGDGPLKAQISTLPCPANLCLQIRPRVSYGELPAVYRAADVAVLPSLGDTWAVVVNEAMASGLPVLGSTRSQAVTELVRDGRDGWQFDPLDADSRAQAINRALSVTTTELTNMGSEAQRRAGEFVTERVAEQYRSVLNSVLQVW